ncbi:DUF927 domain-containing protein [Vibrio sp. MA40-2]|uniref:DUF927 domain-containing protein n=1 Tax=Vibrio sp. MA40-2 TaxID=3391828 RepID=UPI0039A45F9C
MSTNTAIAAMTEQTFLSPEELGGLMGELRPVTTHRFLTEHQLSANDFLVSEKEELYIVMNNVDAELAGVKKITGEQAGIVFGTDNSKAGFFRFAGDPQKITLVTDNILTANKVNRTTNYNSIVIGTADDLESIKSQLAPFSEDAVIVFCYEGITQLEDALDSLSIARVDCSNSIDLKPQIEKAVKTAKLRIPEGYVLNDKGVHLACIGKDGVKRLDWICSPLKVSALTRDIKSQGWGRYIEMYDGDKNLHRYAMPMEMLTGKGFIDPLVNRGLTFEYGAQKSVNQYLMQSQPLQRARSVSKTGWYQDMFVFPEKVIGEKDEKVVYQTIMESPANYESSGTLQEWRENVASLCKGNSRLTFGTSVSFATMLLPLMNGESGGFHFRGASSRGKTTILTLAKSVFGNPQSLPRWRATVNGLEALAASHNHTLLCLDEFSQLAEVSPKQAGEAVYMLGNGEGKVRGKNGGGMQEALSWQLLYLSAGEVSLKSVLDKAGMQVRGGQEVRFIDLSSDAGRNLGAFDTVQDLTDGNEFALAIKRNSLKYYGTAATAFLEEVSADYQGMEKKLADNIREFLSLLDLSESDPQVHRVAQRFAQVAASGELATELGITGWDKGEANKAAVACFKVWVDARGGHGSQEAKAALEQVSNKLVSWGLLRLNSAEQTAARNGAVWGSQDDNFFYIYPNVFKSELCEGLDSQAVEGILKDIGVLIPSKNRVTTQKKYNGKPMWVSTTTEK